MHKLKREGFILVYIVPVVKTKCIATLMLCITFALLKKKQKQKCKHLLQSQISHTAKGKEGFFCSHFYSATEWIHMRCALFTDSSIKGMLLSN